VGIKFNGANKNNLIQKLTNHNIRWEMKFIGR